MNAAAETPLLDALKAGPPILMGILNLTPDSFSDGGQFEAPAAGAAHAMRMVYEGATIIDIGAESTRPGSSPVKLETEWSRLEPVLRQLRSWLKQKNYRKVWLSVDTYKAEIARRSLELGADMINDISGGRYEPEIFSVVARVPNALYVLVHNPFAQRGQPPSAREQSIAYSYPIKQIAAELRSLYENALAAGLRNIIVDPGLGFGKDVPCNCQIVANLAGLAREFCAATEGRARREAGELFCPPILVGASNKRFVRHGLPADTLGNGEDLLGANLAICTAAILGGARIVRSHEVCQHYRCLLKSWQMVQEQQKYG